MDRTRYQILFKDDRPIENFADGQKRKLDARVKVLKAKGVAFTVWDTRRNALSKLFAI